MGCRQSLGGAHPTSAEQADFDFRAFLSCNFFLNAIFNPSFNNLTN
jgi:hypothetical protein